MEQNSLQLNNIHESDFSGFINNGYNLQQPTNTYETSVSSDTLSNINENSTISPHGTQYVHVNNVNNELNNNQQQYATSSTSSASSATIATSTYPAPQYNNDQDLPQYISNVAPAPQLVLQINSPTMIVYESLDYHIILVPKCPCPLVDSNNFNGQDFSQ